MSVRARACLVCVSGGGGGGGREKGPKGDGWSGNKRDEERLLSSLES